MHFILNNTLMFLFHKIFPYIPAFGVRKSELALKAFDKSTFILPFRPTDNTIISSRRERYAFHFF